MASRSILRSELALLTVVAIWGCNFAVMKFAVGHANPFVFNATRFTISVLLLGALHLVDVRAKRAPLLPPRDLWLPVCLLGFTGHVIYQIGFVMGLERTTAGTASLLIASAPLWTALVAHVGGLERLQRRSWLGLGVAFVGTGLVAAASRGVDFGGDALVGNILCVAAAFGWGIYTAWNRPYLERATSLSLALWTMAISLPAIWLLAVPGLQTFSYAEADRAFWGAALFAGGLGTGVAYVLWNVGIRGLGPARTAASTCLVPIIALVVGRVALEEPIKGLQILGGVIVLSGLLMLGRAKADAASGD